MFELRKLHGRTWQLCRIIRHLGSGIVFETSRGQKRIWEEKNKKDDQNAWDFRLYCWGLRLPQIHPRFNSLSPVLKTYENSSVYSESSPITPAHSCRGHPYRSRRVQRDCILQGRSREAAHERRRDERRVHQRLHVGHDEAIYRRCPDGLLPEPWPAERACGRGGPTEPRCDRRQFERLLPGLQRGRHAPRTWGRLARLLPLGGWG